MRSALGAILRAAALLLLVGCTSAKEKPELTLGLAAKQIGGIRSSFFEPVLKWTQGGKVVGCDYAVRTRLHM